MEIQFLEVLVFMVVLNYMKNKILLVYSIMVLLVLSSVNAYPEVLFYKVKDSDQFYFNNVLKTIPDKEFYNVKAIIVFGDNRLRGSSAFYSDAGYMLISQSLLSSNSKRINEVIKHELAHSQCFVKEEKFKNGHNDICFKNKLKDLMK